MRGVCASFTPRAASSLRTAHPFLGSLTCRGCGNARSPSEGTVLDLVYVLLTLAFFALMLWYVAGCARLGRSSEGSDEERHA
jgi:hypothetical protein